MDNITSLISQWLVDIDMKCGTIGLFGFALCVHSYNFGSETSLLDSMLNDPNMAAALESMPIHVHTHARTHTTGDTHNTHMKLAHAKNHNRALKCVLVRGHVRVHVAQTYNNGNRLYGICTRTTFAKV